MMNNENLIKSLTPTFELSLVERFELRKLRLENDVLKRLKNELAIKSNRNTYEQNAEIRKRDKQIEKLQIEINA